MRLVVVHVQDPPERVLVHALPSRDQLQEIASQIATEPGELVLSGAFGDEGRPVLFVLSLTGVDGVGTSVGGSPPIPLLLDSWSRVSLLHPGALGLVGLDGEARLQALRTPPRVPVHAAALILEGGPAIRAVSSPVTYVPGLEPGRGSGTGGAVQAREPL